MISVEQFMDIKQLRAEGQSIRRIARTTGYSRNTIRKVLRGEHSLKYDATGRSRLLEPYQDYVEQRYRDCQLSAVRLLQEIRPMGYEGSVQTLRRFLRPLRQGRRHQQRLTVRFETPPGKQAQADWGYCGRFSTPAGKAVSLYVFSMVLSYSRMLYVQFTTSMKLPALVECHHRAFDYFGGRTEMILYDNMKQVKLSRQRWNEQFLDFAHYYGFVPKTHQPYRPRTKGKVERSMDYIKDNFLNGRSFEGLDDLNARVRHWLDHTANVRVHGTTGKRPLDLFAQEVLISLTEVPVYRFIDPVARTVSVESMIQFQGSRYSVPPDYVGQTVHVAAQGGHILVRLGDTVITEHRQAARKGQCMVHKEHMAELWKVTREQIKPPMGRRWQVAFTQSVQQTPLMSFEEVAV